MIEQYRKTKNNPKRYRRHALWYAMWKKLGFCYCSVLVYYSHKYPMGWFFETKYTSKQRIGFNSLQTMDFIKNSKVLDDVKQHIKEEEDK